MNIKSAVEKPVFAYPPHLLDDDEDKKVTVESCKSDQPNDTKLVQIQKEKESRAQHIKTTVKTEMKEIDKNLDLVEEEGHYKDVLVEVT